MVGQFTKRAESVLTQAGLEARRLRHTYVGTEHVLLGILLEGSGAGVSVLKSCAVELAAARLEVEKRVKPGHEQDTNSERPFSPLVRRVLEHALIQAHLLGHRQIGTEHLLLGLLEEECPALEVLRALGADPETLRGKVLALLGTEDDDILVTSSARFLDPVRRICAAANQEARRARNLQIESEHILAALLKEDAGTGTQILQRLGVNLDRAREIVDELTKRGPDLQLPGKLPRSPRAKLVLKHAVRESTLLGAEQVGSEHVLLGLLGRDVGASAEILQGLGVTLDRARAELLRNLAAPRLAERRAAESGATKLPDEDPDVSAAAICRKDPAGQLLESFLADVERRTDRAQAEGRLEEAAAWQELVAHSRQLLRQLAQLLRRRDEH